MRNLLGIAEKNYYDNFIIDKVANDAYKELEKIGNQSSIIKEIEDANKSIDEVNSQIDNINSCVQEINSAADEINDLIDEYEDLNGVSKVSGADEISSSFEISSISNLELSTDDTHKAIEVLSNAASIDLDSGLNDVFDSIVYGQKAAFEDTINNAKVIAKTFNLNEDDVIKKQKEVFIEKLAEKDLELEFIAYMSRAFYREVESFFNCDLDMDVKEVIGQQIYSAYTSYGLNAPINFTECKTRFENLTNIFDEYKTEDVQEQGQWQRISTNIISSIKNDLNLQAFIVNKFPNTEDRKILKIVNEQILENLNDSPNYALKLLKACLSNQHIYPTQYASSGVSISEYHTEGICNTLSFFTRNKIALDMENPDIAKILTELPHRKSFISEKSIDKKKFSLDFTNKEIENFFVYQKKLSLDKIMDSIPVDETPEDDNNDITTNHLKI